MRCVTSAKYPRSQRLFASQVTSIRWACLVQVALAQWSCGSTSPWGKPTPWNASAKAGPVGRPQDGVCSSSGGRDVGRVVVKINENHVCLYVLASRSFEAELPTFEASSWRPGCRTAWWRKRTSSSWPTQISLSASMRPTTANSPSISWWNRLWVGNSIRCIRGRGSTAVRSMQSSLAMVIFVIQVTWERFFHVFFMFFQELLSQSWGSIRPGWFVPSNISTNGTSFTETLSPRTCCSMKRVISRQANEPSETDMSSFAFWYEELLVGLKWFDMIYLYSV